MRCLIFLLGFLAIAGCAPDEKGPSARLEAPLEAWRVEQDGMLRHVPSGIGFPEVIEGYARTRAIDLAKDGSDIVVIYSVQGVPSVDEGHDIRIYATRHEGISVDQYLEIASKAIQVRYKARLMIDEGTFQPSSGDAVFGRFRLFGDAAVTTNEKTGVWIGKKENWMLKARFSYSGGNMQGMGNAEALLKEIDW